MTKLFKILSVLSLATVAACTNGGSSTSTTGGTATAGGTTTGGGIPGRSAASRQCRDRPDGPRSVNTALTAPLGLGPGPDGGMIAQAQAKVFYNAVSDPRLWTCDFAAGFVSSLGGL